MVLTLLVISAFGQNAREILEWNEFYDLSWYDFQGAPDSESPADAATSVQIKAMPYVVNGDLFYDVYAYFNRRKSWKRDTSPALLRHERLHFDIAELYARKIRQKIRKMRKNGVKDSGVINAAVRKLLLESNSYDELYDLETLHGAIRSKQTKWEQQVQAELSALDSFKKQKRVLRSGG